MRAAVAGALLIATGCAPAAANELQRKPGPFGEPVRSDLPTRR